MKKYTFVEYVAASESKDFNKIDDGMLEWAKNSLTFDPNVVHNGDCTKQCHSCYLCVFELLLSEYHKYYFKPIDPQ